MLVDVEYDAKKSEVVLKDGMEVTRLNDTEQRRILIAIWKNNPGLVRDIICEECPEHLGGSQ